MEKQMSTAEVSRDASTIVKTPQIAIIGGGVAGLRAATLLLDLFSTTSSASQSSSPIVTILEGRSRLGGRLTQTTLPRTDHLVDLGPNWIHGTDHNPILDLAAELNETTHSFGDGDEGNDAESNLVDEYGKPIEKEEAKLLLDYMWGIIVQAFKYSNENFSAGNIDEQTSLYDYFEEKVADAWEDESAETRERRRKQVLQISKMWGAFVGDSIEKQSLKFFWLEECLDGENLFLASTYQRILNRIISIPSQDPRCLIKLGTTVTEINYLDTSSSSAESHIILRTANGETIHFEEVVVTSPLGWLQHNLSAFNPSLPPPLQKSIQEIGYGCLEKVFITFPSAFWDTPGPENEEVHAFTQFLAPSLDLSRNPARHNIEVISLNGLPNGLGHPTLLFYIFGQQAREISHALRGQSAAGVDAQVAKESYLIDYFMPYISKLPGFDKDDKNCTPVSAMFTDWLIDPLAGYGSYSNFQIATDSGGDEGGEKSSQQELNKSIELIREGIPEKGLWFAGEHTSPFVALGTVTGAWWSGEGVAQRIALKYGVPKEKSQSSMETRSEDVHESIHLSAKNGFQAASKTPSGEGNEIDIDWANTQRISNSQVQTLNLKGLDRANQPRTHPVTKESAVQRKDSLSGVGNLSIDEVDRSVRRESAKEINVRGFGDAGLERKGDVKKED